ncbi:MAG: stalk domain-containing protein, partial [Eubacteriales bacterium]|nr:stalk domain-containing protein [Eubacteriales bacterium]
EVNDLLGFPLGGLKDGNVISSYFNKPRDLAVNSAGDIFVADTQNHVVRKISKGTVTTFAGKNTPGMKDGKGSAALFNMPSGIAVDGQDRIYVADTLNNAIRIIDKTGTVSTLKLVSSESTYDYSILNEPSDVALDRQGNLYIADSGNQMIKKVVDGKVYLLAGAVGPKNDLGYVEGGFSDGKAENAEFNFPKGICVLDNGLVFVADTWNHSLRLIKPDHTVVTFAGDVKAEDAVGNLSQSRFNGPSGLAYSQGYLYVSDMWNSSIKKIKLNYGNPVFDPDVSFASKNIDFSQRDKTIINVAVKGKLIDFEDVTTVNIGGKTYFPIRAIAESLGAEVRYDAAKRTAHVRYEGKEISYSLDAPDMKVVNQRSLVHIRTLAGDLGVFVTWNQQYNTVILTQ